jgi:hypothetical protein
MNPIRPHHLLTILAFLNPACRQNQSNFTTRKTAEGIEVSEGTSQVLFYQVKSKDLNGKYERANYIHPLYDLSGKVLTEDFPDDHPHHRGIFWAWHQILINEKHIADGWSCENMQWEVVDTKIHTDKTALTLDNEVLWKSAVKGKKPEAIVRENSKITIHGATDKYRVIDFDISLFAMTDSLKIGGSDDPKGYSGFSLRLKLPKDIRFRAREKEVVAQELGIDAGPWMDFTGSFDGAGLPESGVLVLCHPANPGFPQPWILRSEKSMQNPAWPGRVAVDLTRSGVRLQYRVIIHRDPMSALDVERMGGDFLN